MAPKYEIGQKVVITPVHDQLFSPRDSGIGDYAGRSGKVTDYYWMGTASGEAFYIYTVQMESDREDIVLHEDEIQANME